MTCWIPSGITDVGVNAPDVSINKIIMMFPKPVAASVEG